MNRPMNPSIPRLILAAVLIAGSARVFAQAPAEAPAEPATESALPAAEAVQDALAAEGATTPAADSATAAAQPAGPLTTAEMTLSSAATPRSRQLGVLAKGVPIRIEGGVDNSYGRWLLVSSGAQRGWISSEAPPPTPSG
ncbi:UNVERIFIED_CONTAM: hypothetical protein IGO34_24330, partial [Salmonella enterica subsp. enterica serovar Weltevreden]